MYPYPYGPPYVQPWYTPPKPARTPQGIKWTYLAFILYVSYLAVSVLLAIVAYQLIGSLSTTNLGQALGALIVLAIAAILGAVLGIIVLVFYFLGFGYLYGGRNEFGPGHARNVRLALYLMIAALATVVTGLVVGAILNSRTIRFLPGGTLQVDAGAYYLAIVTVAIVGIVGAALVAATLVLSLRGLARPEHHRLLYAAAGLGTATPGVFGAIELWQLPKFLSAIQSYLDGQNGGFVSTPPIDPSIGYPAIAAAALGLVTFALYVYVCHDIYGRLRSGELKPVLPPSTPIGSWMPAPVAPPYPAPYPVSPPVPPPQGPPP